MSVHADPGLAKRRAMFVGSAGIQERDVFQRLGVGIEAFFSLLILPNLLLINHKSNQIYLVGIYLLTRSEGQVLAPKSNYTFLMRGPHDCCDNIDVIIL